MLFSGIDLEMSRTPAARENFCNTHGKEHTFYCPDCQLPLCQTCIGPHLIDGKAHRLKSIQDAVKEINEKVKEQEASFDEFLQKQLHALQQQRQVGNQVESETVSRFEWLRQLSSRALETVQEVETAMGTSLLQRVEFGSGYRSQTEETREFQREVNARSRRGRRAAPVGLQVELPPLLFWTIKIIFAECRKSLQNLIFK